MIRLTPIETLQLHPRAYSALLDNGVNYVEHLVLYDWHDLVSLRGMGHGLARCIKESLGARGKTLSTVEPVERRQWEFEVKYGQEHPEAFVQEDSHSPLI